MSHLISRSWLGTGRSGLSLVLWISLSELLGCGGSDSGGQATGLGGSQPGTATGGASTIGSNSGGAVTTGGKPGTGGTSGVAVNTGGTPQTGGAPATGGAQATGGAPAMGGRAATGGAPATGGSSPGSGGRLTGGASATGGSSTAGGASTAGGTRTITGGATAAGGSNGGSSAAGATAAGGAGNAKPSAGCSKTPTLKNSPTATANQNTLTVSGASRQFLIRWPTNYDNTHPYRLILDFHGATGKDTDIGPSYFGLFDLSNNSTIFVAPSASGGIWALPSDLTFVDQILTAVEADLCIDTSRIEIEGFSQGAALVWNLACQRPGVFRAAVGHSGGGLAAPSSCQPIPYFGSGGLQESVTQTTQTDQFAKFDGCTVSSLPTAPSGGHVCTSYTGCPAADPVRWCNFDGPHSPSPTDSGKTTSWMPAEVWPFFSQF